MPLEKRCTISSIRFNVKRPPSLKEAKNNKLKIPNEKQELKLRIQAIYNSRIDSIMFKTDVLF